jgi:hypothetical protein
MVFTNLVDNFIDLEQVGEPILTSFVPGVPNSACPSLPPGLCMPPAVSVRERRTGSALGRRVGERL